MLKNSIYKGKRIYLVLFLSFIFLSLINFTSSIGLSRNSQNVNVYVINSSEVTLGNLSDVNIPSPSDKNFLQYDSASGKWIVYSFSLIDWWDYDYNDLINEPTTISSFTNNLGYWNSTFATFNKTYADNLYYGINNPYSYYNSTSLQNISQVNNDLNYWNDTYSTFNKTYADTIYYGINNPYSFFNTTSLTNQYAFYNITTWDNPYSYTNDSLNDNRYRLLTNNTFLGDNTFTGRSDWNGGWSSNGLSIINGDLYAQTGYFYNITGLNVNTLTINGTQKPIQDNSFDIGDPSLRWRSGYFATSLNTNGTGYFGGNVGIGTTSPDGTLNLAKSGSITQFIDSYSATDSHLPALSFRKSGSDTIGTVAATVAGEELGIIDFWGTRGDGAARLQAAKIRVVEAGAGPSTIGANMEFWTNLQGISASTEPRMIITQAGNVGIGTTSPGKLLEIEATSNTQTLGASTAAIQIHNLYGSTTDTPSELLFASFTGTNPVFAGVHGLVNNAGTAGSAGDLAFSVRKVRTDANLTEIMRISNTGNVGIGTTAPENFLHVNAGASDEKGITIKGSSNPMLVIDASGGISTTGNAFIKFINDASSTSTISMVRSGLASDQMRFLGATGGYVFSDGNVGIGTTNPIRTLQVNGTIWAGNATDGVGLGLNGAVGTIYGLSPDSFYNDLELRTGPSGTGIYINTAGNVGIGTTSPGAKLHVVQAAEVEGLRIDGASSGFVLLAEGGTKRLVSARNLAVGNSYAGVAPPAEGAIIQGNVGIGTTSPQNKLNVIGSFNQSGSSLSTFNGIYGGLYSHNDSGTQYSLDVSNSYYNFTGGKCGINNGVTCNNITTDNLTIQYAGVYKVEYRGSGAGGNNHLYHTIIFVNGVEQQVTEGHMLASSGDIQQIFGDGKITLNVGDVVHVGIKDSTGTGTITIYNTYLSLDRVGN